MKLIIINKVNFFLIILLFFSCKSQLSNKQQIGIDKPTLKKTSKIDSIQVVQKKYKKLFERKVKFEDGAEMNMTLSYRQKIKIDSIITQRKIFNGSVVSCFKAQVRDSLFQEIRKSDIQEFKKITNIHTVFSIKLAEQDDTIHINTKNSVDYHKVLDKKSKIYCTIYQMYSKNEFIANIPIIEKVVEIKE